MTIPRIVAAELTWTGRGFEPELQVAVASDGTIEAVGRLDRTPDLALKGCALLPGFVNAHSHAFQRGLRGRAERFNQRTGNFWSWRDAMYGLVERLDEEEFYRLCVQAFREMLSCGITTVGEFHYLHHKRGQLDWSYDRLVLAAAREVGIRIVLLLAYYKTGGPGRALGPAQRRFDGLSPAAYWDQVDRLAAEIAPDRQHLGAVAHSVRAVAPEDIASLHREALRRGLVFHLHLEEQRQEIAECRSAYGRTPMRLLLEMLETTRNVTAVHCTHTEPEELAQFLERGGTVCVCPLTEANLGDGVPKLDPMIAAPGRVALGTDSNARISMIEEMRWLEYGQRLRREGRGVFRPEDGWVARGLLEAATEGGARALGLATGRIAPGLPADFCVVDLRAPELAGADPDTVLDALVFGGGTSAVRGASVGGRWHLGPAAGDHGFERQA